MRQQPFQAIRFSAENNDGDVSTIQILLEFHAPINGDQNVEIGCFGGRQKLAILETSKAACRAVWQSCSGK